MIRKLRTREHGQALVEMALVLPIFLILMFGVFEMGFIGYAYITVSYAAGEGGRVASLGGNDDQIKTAIEKAVTTLDLARLKDPEITPAVRQSGQNVTVKVTYTVQLNIPLIIIDSVDVSSSIIMRME